MGRDPVFLFPQHRPCEHAAEQQHGHHGRRWGDNNITQNRIEGNAVGLEINCSCADRVERNTFLGNTVQAVFAKLPYWELDHRFEARYFKVAYVLANYHVFGSTTWDGNYWNASLDHPYLVRGWSVFWHGHNIDLPHIPRVEVDRHPAQQPYAYSPI